MSITTHRQARINGEIRRLPLFSPRKKYSSEDIARRVRRSVRTIQLWKKRLFADYFAARDERIPTDLKGVLAQYLIENGKDGKPYAGKGAA